MQSEVEKGQIQEILLSEFMLEMSHGQNDIRCTSRLAEFTQSFGEELFSNSGETVENDSGNNTPYLNLTITLEVKSESINTTSIR